MEKGPRQADEVVARRHLGEVAAAERGLAGAQGHQLGRQVQAEDLVHLEPAVLAASRLQLERREQRVEPVPGAVGGEMQSAELAGRPLEGALRRLLPDQEPMAPRQ